MILLSLRGRREWTKQRRFLSSGKKSDDGVVVGVWVFCRHGDRVPNRYLCPPHKQDEESAFWLKKLPNPSTAAVYRNFCAVFPTLIDDFSGKFSDVSRNPFGFLTHKGILQCQANGRAFRKAYDHNNQDPNNEDGSSMKSEAARGMDFIKQWNIRVQSTNYLRTVLSVQSFLDGMLDTKCYTEESGPTEREKRDYSTRRNPQEWPVPDHHFIRPPLEDSSPNTAKVLVRVRDQTKDNLNAFDRNPDLMDELVGNVMQSHPFQQYDATKAPLAAKLANILPGLVRHHKLPASSNPMGGTRSGGGPSTNPMGGTRSAPSINPMGGTTARNHGIASSINTPDGRYKPPPPPPPPQPKKPTVGRATSPSGINWVEATDHFVCRQSHELPLSEFTNVHGSPSHEASLESMAYTVKNHLAWRFRQWFQSPALLAAISAPLLREIAEQLDTARKHQPDRPPYPMGIYSCHDVTILALLYALGADFLAPSEALLEKQSAANSANVERSEDKKDSQDHSVDPPRMDEWREYWPEYSSMLVIELIRYQNYSKPLHDTHWKDRFKFTVRVKINGRTVRSVDFRDQAKPLGTSGPNKDALSVKEFWNIVTRLEEEGEYDFSRWPSQDD